MNRDEFCKTFGVERRGTNSLKWDALQERFGDADLTPLWVADMDFKTVPEAVEALKKRADHGAFGYSRVPDTYYDAFFAWQNRHGRELRKEDIRFASGVVGSLYAAVHCLTAPGDAVVICPPVYYPFSRVVINSGRKLAPCELDNTAGRYSLDMDKFERVIAESGAKLFILCSPHNPVGRVWTEKELETMFEICRAHGTMVAADEIHQDFISPGYCFVPAALVSGGKYREMLITLTSCSKTFNLAGLPHSQVIIHSPDLRKKYDEHITAIGQAETNVLAFAAAEAAFRHGGEWLEGLQGVIQRNYVHMKTEFSAKAPAVIITPLEGTYLMWMDLRACVKPAETFDFVKKKCRLAVDPGEWFIDRGGEGFIRINLATLPEYVELAARNIIEKLTKNSFQHRVEP